MVWIVIPFLIFSVIGSFFGILNMIDRIDQNRSLSIIVIMAELLSIMWAVVIAVLTIVK